MKKFMKSTLAIAAGAAAIAGAVTIPSLVSAWGDSNGGRPSYTYEQINQGVLGDKIVFNSISDGVIGDEKNFVGARENTGINAGKDNVWNGNDINVENGKEYLIRLYVHNNSPKGMDAVAENTHVSFNIPNESARDIRVNGFIKADNADPQEYWDHVDLHSDTAFHLEYVYGSALLENQGIGKSVQNGGQGPYQLSDDIVKAASGGTLIGYDAIDGRIPGCDQYAAFVTIRVKVVYDTDYTVDKKVRIHGDADKTWKDQVDAKIGDELDFRIEYRNISDQKQEHVVIRDSLPSNLEYIADSTEIVNSSHPNGAKVNSDALVADTGITIGDYNGQSNAIIYFRAKVVDMNLVCGKNTMTNWGRASVNQKLMMDWARVVTEKDCTPPSDDPEPTPTPTPTPENPTPETPTELPTTGPEAIIGGVIATGSIVTAAGYYLASRRSLR